MYVPSTPLFQASQLSYGGLSNRQEPNSCHSFTVPLTVSVGVPPAANPGYTVSSGGGRNTGRGAGTGQGKEDHHQGWAAEQVTLVDDGLAELPHIKNDG